MTQETPPIPKWSHLLTDPPYRPKVTLPAEPQRGEAFEFPRQSIWWPYWKGRSLEDVINVAWKMSDSGIDGVVLMGMEWGNQYALPSDIEAKVEAFRSIGIEPYVALWIGTLRDEEATTALRAIKAANWSGVILDVEHQWKDLCRDNLDQARNNFTSFMGRVRLATPKLGYAPYGVPTYHKVYQYEWWNEACDFVLPQIYFSADQTADYILSRALTSWTRISRDWTTPLKPLIPLGNCYGERADVEQRRLFGQRAIREYGGVSWWRWPLQNPAMAPMLAEI